MAKLTPINDRPPPMTKTELYEMLAQAVRNTQLEKEPLAGSKDRKPQRRVRRPVGEAGKQALAASRAPRAFYATEIVSTPLSTPAPSVPVDSPAKWLSDRLRWYSWVGSN